MGGEGRDPGGGGGRPGGEGAAAECVPWHRETFTRGNCGRRGDLRGSYARPRGPKVNTHPAASQPLSIVAAVFVLHSMP